jgi:hypothetical protein
MTVTLRKVRGMRLKLVIVDVRAEFPAPKELEWAWHPL